MPKGQKTKPEMVYKVMLSMFSTDNFSKTADELNMPVTTVERIYKRNKDKEEFLKLCEKTKDEFVETATRIINKGTSLLEKRLDIATSDVIDFDELISDIFNAPNEEIKENKKKALVNKIMRLQINGLSEITTAIGTMYDKRALAKGDPTSNEKLTIKVSLTDE